MGDQERKCNRDARTRRDQKQEVRGKSDAEDGKPRAEETDEGCAPDASSQALCYKCGQKGRTTAAVNLCRACKKEGMYLCQQCSHDWHSSKQGHRIEQIHKTREAGQGRPELPVSQDETNNEIKDDNGQKKMQNNKTSGHSATAAEKEEQHGHGDHNRDDQKTNAEQLKKRNADLLSKWKKEKEEVGTFLDFVKTELEGIRNSSEQGNVPNGFPDMDVAENKQFAEITTLLREIKKERQSSNDQQKLETALTPKQDKNNVSDTMEGGKELQHRLEELETTTRNELLGIVQTLKGTPYSVDKLADLTDGDDSQSCSVLAKCVKETLQANRDLKRNEVRSKLRGTFMDTIDILSNEPYNTKIAIPNNMNSFRDYVFLADKIHEVVKGSRDVFENYKSRLGDLENQVQSLQLEKDKNAKFESSMKNTLLETYKVMKDEPYSIREGSVPSFADDLQTFVRLANKIKQGLVDTSAKIQMMSEEKRRAEDKFSEQVARQSEDSDFKTAMRNTLLVIYRTLKEYPYFKGERSTLTENSSPQEYVSFACYLQRFVKRNGFVEKVEQLDKALKSKEKELAFARQEKEELATRLSKLAGANLRSNNPNIADLSDPNRPTKLAEMYSELYDNQWTDAYAAMEKEGKRRNVTPSSYVKELLLILKECYTFCLKQSEDQMKQLKDVMSRPASACSKKRKGSDLTDALLTNASDLRKGTASESLQDIKKVFKDNKDHKDMYKKDVDKYTEQCLTVCWYMCLQSPPVVIDQDTKAGDRLDTSRYKAYTKAGEQIDFVVWPAAFLHHGGPLLSKGIAQGRDKTK